MRNQTTAVLGDTVPHYSQMSFRYHSASCRSMDSEKLFSSVSQIVDENKNTLTADHAEKLLIPKRLSPWSTII